MRTRPANPDELPDDVDALKALIQDQAAQLETERQRHTAERQRHTAERQRHHAEKQRYRTEIDTLREQLHLLLHAQYGPSSEKAPDEQMRLFNEAEAEADAAAGEHSDIAVPAHTRKKRGRKPLPEILPRVRVEHDLPHSDKVCGCGYQLTRIGEETSEQLDIIPAQVRVIQHVRPTYACKACEETIRTAKLPPQPIPKSNASPGLLAHIAVAKFQDALPLYRQEQILQRIGVDIPRATLANWMIKVGVLVQPLIRLCQDHLHSYDILGMDETPFQVLKEPGRKATSKSYLWVQRGGPPGQRAVLFHYDPSRGQAVAQELLADYTGFVQADGYGVYAAIDAANPNITLLGCMAHARRKFDQAVKAQGKKGKPGKALQALSLIRKLYGIEAQLKGKSAEERYRVRQDKARPILDELRKWLDKALPDVAPQSATGKALHYLHNQWDMLIRYLEDGRLSIDNNATERAIKPFVIGRKNWLFADTQRGATASANLYSLIETAKANGLEPYHYLRYLLSELPDAETLEQLEALLPWNLTPEQLAIDTIPSS